MTDAYLKRVGLTEDQIRTVRRGLERESKYRQIMLRLGVHYKIACVTADQADPDSIDDNEDLLIEKVKAEFKSDIRKDK